MNLCCGFIFLFHPVSGFHLLDPTATLWQLFRGNNWPDRLNTEGFVQRGQDAEISNMFPFMQFGLI